MKKVTTFLLSLLAVLGVFTFAACGNEGETDNKDKEKPVEIKTTVTETEWKAAFNLFCDEPFKEGKEPLQLTVLCDGSYEDEKQSMKLEVNYKNKVMHFVMGDPENKDNNYLEYYNWLENDIFYSAEITDSIHKGIEDDVEFYSQMVEDYLSYYAGAHFMRELFLNNFAKFTYSEQNKEYSGEIKYKSEEPDAEEVTLNCSVAFADGKVAKLKTNDIEEVKAVYEYKFTYSSDVAVPANILSMPVKD